MIYFIPMMKISIFSYLLLNYYIEKKKVPILIVYNTIEV